MHIFVHAEKISGGNRVNSLRAYEGYGIRETVGGTDTSLSFYDEQTLL